MRLEVNGKGLTREEIQDCIDRAKEFKSIPLTELMERQQERILEVLELDKDFAIKALDCIRQHHPDLANKK